MSARKGMSDESQPVPSSSQPSPDSPSQIEWIDDDAVDPSVLRMIGNSPPGYERDELHFAAASLPQAVRGIERHQRLRAQPA
jgi:hypothetical protein